MKHRATPRFWCCYHELPAEVRDLADGCYRLLKEDSRHPSLHFKRIGSLWSVRNGMHHRALAVDDHGEAVWFWIGTHGEYDRLLKNA